MLNSWNFYKTIQNQKQMDESIEQLSEKHMLLNFLSCFYFDHFKQLDIAWDRYIPFATLYGRLFSIKSHLTDDTIVFKPDQARIYMIMAILLGQLRDSIDWQLDNKGRMVVKSITLPKHYMSAENQNKIDIDSVSNDMLVIDEEYLMNFFYNNAQTWHKSTVRDLCYQHYGSFMEEMTELHKIIYNLIWRVGSLAFE